MSESKKLALRRIEEEFDFRKLGKAKLDGVINNAHLLTTDKNVKQYMFIKNYHCDDKINHIIISDMWGRRRRCAGPP